MSNKTANVMARIEEPVKTEAEGIISALGLSTSAVINALYRQIIITKSIPFTLSLAPAPASMNADAMSNKEIIEKLQRGVDQATSGKTVNAKTEFDNFRMLQ